jgi:subtilisin family serine protease
MRKNYIVTLKVGYTYENLVELSKKCSATIFDDYDALDRIYKIEMDEIHKQTFKEDPAIYHIVVEDAPVNLMVKVRTASMTGSPDVLLMATPTPSDAKIISQTFTVDQNGYGGNWGLARICQKNNWNDATWFPFSGKFESWRSAPNVDIYIVDTGINKNHNDFKNRFSVIYDHYKNVSDPNFGVDLNGHGTHVASIAAGSTYGVAKKATLKIARVFETGCTTVDAIISGINACLNDHNTKKNNGINRPSVMNLSLGGPAMKTEEIVINACIDAGIIVVAAAGNDGMNLAAQDYDILPAEVARAITVGATDIQDKITSFSNYGSGIDVFAPGMYIVAADWRTNAGQNMLSGTSMSAPFVAGICALKLEETPSTKSAADVKKIHDWIISTSTINTLHFNTAVNKARTPNRLVWCGFLTENTAVVAPSEPVKELSRSTVTTETVSTKQSEPITITTFEDKTTVSENDEATTTIITRYYTTTTSAKKTTTTTKTPITTVMYSDGTSKTIAETPIVNSTSEDVIMNTSTRTEIISNVVIPKQKTIIPPPPPVEFKPDPNFAQQYKTVKSSKNWSVINDKQVLVFLDMLTQWENKFEQKYNNGDATIETKMIEIVELMYKYSGTKGALRTPMYRKFISLRDEISDLLK